MECPDKKKQTVDAARLDRSASSSNKARSVWVPQVQGTSVGGMRVLSLLPYLFGTAHSAPINKLITFSTIFYDLIVVKI